MRDEARSLLVLLGALALCSASDGSPRPDVVGAVPSAARETMLAFRVAAWARAHGDARAMIVAARILSELPEGAARTEASPLPISRAGLLAEARAMAGGDPAISSLATTVAATEPKGASRGPSRWGAEIPPGGSWQFRFTVRGGELLYVMALGDGDAPLGLELRDPADRLVCASASGQEVDCRATPAFSAPYSARIFNRGRIATKTLAVSN